MPVSIHSGAQFVTTTPLTSRSLESPDPVIHPTGQYLSTLRAMNHERENQEASAVSFTGG
jgi:hypothetical protein